MFYASKFASQAAHLAALAIIEKNLQNEQNELAKPEPNSLEFELDEDLIKFYEESLRFKLEKRIDRI